MSTPQNLGMYNYKSLVCVFTCLLSSVISSREYGVYDTSVSGLRAVDLRCLQTSTSGADVALAGGMKRIFLEVSSRASLGALQPFLLISSASYVCKVPIYPKNVLETSSS